MKKYIYEYVGNGLFNFNVPGSNKKEKLFKGKKVILEQKLTGSYLRVMKLIEVIEEQDVKEDKKATKTKVKDKLVSVTEVEDKKVEEKEEIDVEVEDKEPVIEVKEENKENEEENGDEEENNKDEKEENNKNKRRGRRKRK